MNGRIGVRISGNFMHLNTFRVVVLASASLATLWTAPPRPANAEATTAVGEDFFVEKLYPVFDQAQCAVCHNDAGIASDTNLRFPSADAGADEIRSFGLWLAAFVDAETPDRSLLYRKPTSRVEHIGGERIPKNSENEKLLLRWVDHLARLPKPESSARPGGGPTAEKHPSAMRRLTHSQYNNTVRDLLGDQTRPASQFPPEDFIRGYKNQTEGQSIPPLLAEAYGSVAEKLARNVFRGGDRNRLIPCEAASAADRACSERFVGDFGRRVFRRPLTEAEVSHYNELFRQEARKTGEFLSGARIVVEAMLQSPNFLFRIERGLDGPWYPYEIATRLSYFLWDTMPNDWLFDQAGAGELNKPEQVEKAARRMLDDPRAVRSFDEFLAQWLRFDRVLHTIRDRRLYRNFSPELAASMTEETKRLFRHLVWGDRNFMEFFTADYAFLSSDLASLYGIPAPDEEFAMVRFAPDSGRAGVLGQAMFHTVTSKPSDTSPTERGLFVRKHFLCQVVPPPPPGLNASLPPVTDDRPMTNRERLSVHLTSTTCASCHRLIDPIGFGLEQYDAIGQFRDKHYLTIYPTRDERMKKIKTKETKYEMALDTSAEVAGIPNSSFSTPKELGAILAGNRSCRKCVVRQLFRYAMGRHETKADRAVIDRVFENFEQSDFRFRELILLLVRSESFLGDAG